MRMEEFIKNGKLGKFEAMMRDPLKSMEPGVNMFYPEAENKLGRMILTILARLLQDWTNRRMSSTTTTASSNDPVSKPELNSILSQVQI